MVGGFSSSDWLYDQVAQVLRPKGFDVVRPDNYVYVLCPSNLFHIRADTYTPSLCQEQSRV